MRPAFNNLQILGFDARVDQVKDWSEERRRRYLLKPDVLQPRSVDAAVWPSVFEDDVRAGAEGESGVGGWRGPNGTLWESIERLVEVLKPASARAQTYRIVAVTARSTRASSHPFVPVVDSTASKMSWKSMGYDVCDAGLLSGLMNCGYSESERTTLAHWEALLNSDHLFNDEGNALQFTTERAVAVPEHAPFFALELWNLAV